MVVFYTASYYGKEKYQKYYDQVRRAIESMHVELISPETENYLNVLDDNKRKEITDPKLLHYEAIRQGIHVSDAVVIEVSHEDFQLGHEATLAIMDKKPVLCLSIHEDFSRKINNDYFFGARYTRETIGAIVQDFFVSVRQMRQARRFNMFLYPTQVAYLNAASKKNGMNMSEYIRRLITIDRRNSNKGE